LDVMHAFASGYAPADLLEVFDEKIGINYLRLIHANDAKSDLGSRIDRHEHIGQGKIGKKSFRKWLRDKRLKKINFILETPSDKRSEDIKLLKALQKSQK